MSAELLERPTVETDDPLYSNMDHCLDDAVVLALSNAPGRLCAQHAAWNFCGYVWQLQDGRWVDQVWRYNAPVADVYGDSLEEVIEEVNDTYGHE